MNNLIKTLGAIAVFASPLSVSTASAQQQGQEQARASGWFKTCQENDTRKVCNVQFRITGPNDINITTLNLVEITGDVDRRVFQIVVPTGRSLPQGIQLQVDGKRATVIPYLFCRPQACTAEVGLDDTLVNIFKRGGSLSVTTINFQGDENPVPVTLQGFTAAYDGPPTNPNAAAERQQSLAEQLQKKAEEARQNEEAATE